MAGIAVPNVRKVMGAAQAYNAGGGGGIPAPGGISATPGVNPSTSITPVTPWGTSSQVNPGVTTPYFDPSAGPTGSLVNPTGGGGRIEHDLNSGISSSGAPIGGGGGGGAGGGGGSGGAAGGGAAPNLDTGSIMSLINQLKGPQEPRENVPQAPGHVAAPIPVAQPPSSSLGFARFKDQSGRIGAAALRAAKDAATERGISGSGIEDAGASNIIGQIGAQQSDAAYQQQKTAEQQAWDAAQQGYQGDITQRSQDLGLSTTGYQGGIQQRAQDMGQNDLTSLAPTLLQLMFRSGGRVY